MEMTCFSVIGLPCSSMPPFSNPRSAQACRVDQQRSLGFICTDLFPYEIVSPGQELAHALFNFLQVFWGECTRQVKIIVKTIVNGRTNGDFSLGNFSSTASAITCAVEWRMRYNAIFRKLLFHFLTFLPPKLLLTKRPSPTGARGLSRGSTQILHQGVYLVLPVTGLPFSLLCALLVQVHADGRFSAGLPGASLTLWRLTAGQLTTYSSRVLASGSNDNTKNGMMQDAERIFYMV